MHLGSRISLNGAYWLWQMGQRVMNGFLAESDAFLSAGDVRAEARRAESVMNCSTRRAEGVLWSTDDLVSVTPSRQFLCTGGRFSQALKIALRILLRVLGG